MIALTDVIWDLNVWRLHKNSRQKQNAEQNFANFILVTHNLWAIGIAHALSEIHMILRITEFYL